MSQSRRCKENSSHLPPSPSQFSSPDTQRPELTTKTSRFFCQWKHISILLIKAKQYHTSSLALYFPLHMTISFPGLWASLVAPMVKNLPAKQETRVRSLGWEDPWRREMATDSSILAWRIPWTEEPGRLQSRGSQMVRHT